MQLRGAPDPQSPGREKPYNPPFFGGAWYAALGRRTGTGRQREREGSQSSGESTAGCVQFNVSGEVHVGVDLSPRMP